MAKGKTPNKNNKGKKCFIVWNFKDWSIVVLKFQGSFQWACIIKGADKYELKPYY